jgi:hypothetical protein
MTWSKKVGIIFDSLDYPVYFGGGLRGFKAKKEIRHREMIAAVPYTAILDSKKAIKDPVLKVIFSDHKEYFGEDLKTILYNNMVLCIYVMYEW